MSATQWLDIEKCKDLVAFEELERRDVTCLIEISLLPTLKNTFGYRFFKKALIMMSAFLALSIVNIFYKRGDGNMKDCWIRTLDDLAEDAGRRCHFGVIFAIA